MQGFSSHTKPTRVIENKTKKKKERERQRLCAFRPPVGHHRLHLHGRMKAWRRTFKFSSSSSSRGGERRKHQSDSTVITLLWNMKLNQMIHNCAGRKGRVSVEGLWQKVLIYFLFSPGWRQKKTKQWTIRSWGSFLISRCGLAPL